MRPRLRRDDGMTLIELMISVLILVIVVTPLILVLEFAFSASNATSQNTTESAGAQLMSSYFVSDVQGADFVWTNTQHTDFTKAIPQSDPSLPPVATTQCGGNATVLELQWRDGSSNAATPPVLAATYDVVPASAFNATSGLVSAPASLVRHTWQIAAGTTTCTSLDSTTLVYTLNQALTSPARAVQLTCVPVNCNDPNSVEISINAMSQDVHSGLYNKPYTYDLTASRRSS